MTTRRTPRTLLDRIWNQHVVARLPGAGLLYIDLHLLDDLHSPQAFSALRAAGRAVRKPEAAIAIPDHAVPTTDRSGGIADAAAPILVETLAADAHGTGVRLIPFSDPRQGIVHVVGPELGLSPPGLTIASGDSLTRGRGGRARATGGARRANAAGARVWTGKAAGAGGGRRPRFVGGWLRVTRAGLLDMHRHERGPGCAGTALRQHL